MKGDVEGEGSERGIWTGERSVQIGLDSLLVLPSAVVCRIRAVRGDSVVVVAPPVSCRRLVLPSIDSVTGVERVASAADVNSCCCCCSP